MTSRSKDLGSAIVVVILLCVILRQTCAAEAAGRAIETHLANQGYRSAVFDKPSAYQLIGRMGRSEEVAALANFLLSDEAAFIAGAAYDRDGGVIGLR